MLRWALCILLVPFLLAAGFVLWRAREHRYFPDKSWHPVSSADIGFDTDRLRQFSNRIGGTGCIVYKGRIAYAWGDVSKRYDVASAGKPFYAHFTLAALDKGLLDSLDEPVVNWVPELDDLNEHLDFKDRAITFRHLLDQTSGYGLSESPGEAFGYNDYQTGLLVWTLFRRVYACGYGGADRLLHDLLGVHLQFEDDPTFQSPGSWPGRLSISARDMARFGYLYLMDGDWRGASVIDKALVNLTRSSPLPTAMPQTQGLPAERFHSAHSIGGGLHEKGHAGAHSFFWWLNRENSERQRLLPDATPQTFAAMGYGGKFMLIGMPEHRLVVVWMDAFQDDELSPFDNVGRHRVNDAIRELLAAKFTFRTGGVPAPYSERSAPAVPRPARARGPGQPRYSFRARPRSAPAWSEPGPGNLLCAWRARI